MSNNKVPFVPISCNVRALTLFNDLTDAGIMWFCLLCASQNEYHGLQPGEFFVSKVAMAKRLHISRDTLALRLNRLEHAGYIVTRTTYYGTVIAVQDWQAWHNGETPSYGIFVEGGTAESSNPYAYEPASAWEQIRQGDMGTEATTNNNKQGSKEEQRNTNNNTSVSFSSPSLMDDFDRLWFAYPAHRRTRKTEAGMLYERAVQNGATIDAMMRALTADMNTTIWEGGQGKYIPGIVKWLERESWREYLTCAEEEYVCQEY